MIYQFFQNNCDARGIPNIPNSEWLTFTAQHAKEDVKLALAEYISKNNIPFPSKIFEQSAFETTFDRFCRTSRLGEYKDFATVLEKAEYKYPYSDNPLGVIDKSHVYNIVSNYFQQENRMRCGSNLVDGPWDIWHDKAKLEKMNWHFWRKGALGNDDVCAASFRSAFRIGTYTATQFKPSVAKALYEKHNAVNVLDTSCGWGDRLAGFYATKCTNRYVGCDPNPEVFETYKQQCLEYERLLGNTPVLTESSHYFKCQGVKVVEIYNLPSEDVDWSLYQNTFDFYFTSPPYFETERYGASTAKITEQSWSRYPTFDSWKNDFFFKVNRMVWNTIKHDGYMMINIIEPRIHNGKRLMLCDDMVDDILTYPDSNYLGKIGMRMQARPHSIINTDKNSIFVEPIWVFRKGSTEYPKTRAFDELFTVG
jgi:hypothetical protein